MSLDVFVRSYLNTLLWSETDDSGEPLDRNYSIEDISTDVVEAAEKDCAAFLEKFGGELTEDQHDDAGYDFALTQNGHGVSFEDRDYYDRDLAKRMRDYSRAISEVSLYVGDDGIIHFM